LEFFFGDVDPHLFGQLSASGGSVGLSALQTTAGQCDSALVGVADQEQAFIVPDRHVGTLEGGTPQSPLHEQGAVAQPKSSSVQRIPHGGDANRRALAVEYGQAGCRRARQGIEG
jgi:hypothetical protein